MSLGAFLTALQFLTRIPIRRAEPPTASEVRDSLLYYPLVGLLIGAILAIVAALLGHSGDTSVTAALLLSLWVVITGGLHLDGLADCADAWVGGQGDRDKTLLLMKDPHCGAMAIIALMLLLLLKFVALGALLSKHLFALIVLAPVLGRMAVGVLFCTTPYVRANGLGSGLDQGGKMSPSFLIPLAITTISVIWSGGIGLMVVAGCGLVLFTLRRLACARLGGITGDVAGAVLEVIEATALLTASLLV